MSVFSVTKVMKKTLLFFMILWLVTSCGADRNLRRGEKYLALGEYYDAANEFRQAYQKTPAKERARRGQIARKMAMCYDKSLQSARALAAWRNAIRYQQADTADRLAFAQTLMKNGNYREAEEQFQLVLDSLPHDKLARDGLFAARKAPDIKQLGSRYTVKRMEVFNSRRADYCPVLFGDEYDQLYFTSTRNEAQGDELSGITGTKPGDLFFSQKDDKGKWSEPEDVSGGVNTAYDEGACCFSADGREMFLTQCVTDPSYPRYAQIVKSSRSDAAWGKARCRVMPIRLSLPTANGSISRVTCREEKAVSTFGAYASHRQDTVAWRTSASLSTLQATRLSRHSVPMATFISPAMAIPVLEVLTSSSPRWARTDVIIYPIPAIRSIPKAMTSA